MSSAIPNLWPTDLAPTAERTPLSILKEQATQLGAQTKNLLEGQVTTSASAQGEDRLFQHVFNIVAPALDGYKYQLLTVTHKLDPYPVTVRQPFRGVNALAQRLQAQGEKLASESEFIDYLRKVFASDETRRVIGALLAQIQS
jgi:hypothetical protein